LKPERPKKVVIVTVKPGALNFKFISVPQNNLERTFRHKINCACAASWIRQLARWAASLIKGLAQRTHIILTITCSENWHRFLEKSAKLNNVVEHLKNEFYYKMAQSLQIPWEPAGNTGTDIKQYNINCTTGQEILVDYGQRFTTMGQMFFDRWRSQNKTTIVKFTDNSKLTTNIQIGGRLYPTTLSLVNGMLPVTIGRDFFLQYNWQEPKDLVIATEIGSVCLRQVGSLLWIDEELTTKATYCEEVFHTISTVEKQVKKLHDYFGHVSAESLIKILKASS